jgi:glycerophosphoryl diester phosphodiesterase
MFDRIGLQQMPLVTGHRGAAGVRPENTLAAFTYAAEIGCDGVELDIHLTRDGVPVVIHDFELFDKGRNIAVAEADARELTDICVGEGEKIPTLNAVLELLEPTNLYVQIELKGVNTEEPAVEIIRKYAMERRTIFTSFIHKRVLKVKELMPEVRTGILLSSVPVCLVKVAHHAYADNIHLDHRRITPEIVEKIHRCGKILAAWGNIGEDHQFDRLFNLGVDMIGSDWPERLLQRRDVFFGG